MLEMLKQYLVQALYLLPGIVVALTFHEFAHAFVSTKLGDPLPRATGRLSLNPAKHIDPLGFVMLFLVRFGWAKPVVVDSRYYKHKKLGMSLVALAGPVANLIMAFLFTASSMLVAVRYNTLWAAGTTGKGMTALLVIYQLLTIAVSLNIGLAVFNLIPISPLDGSKLLAAFLPMRAYNKVLQYERYGFLILLLLLLDVPGRLLGICGVPSSITQYVDLSYYLNYARAFLMNLFQDIWTPVFELFL